MILNQVENYTETINFEQFSEQVLQDYYTVVLSREVSLLGRKEVLTGKAKFGIFGDGKELPQVVLAKYFKEGDFRSGYYRDQTFMFASGLSTPQEFFAQLYADTNPAHEPASAGRQMNAHFSTPFIKEDGSFIDFTNHKNVTADISPTAGQMVRSLGVALASNKFRNIPELSISSPNLSDNGNEISVVTIGDASTSEGYFWETINAAAVQQVPLAVFVWDDGYGISVPQKYQTTKQSISKCLKGMEYNSEEGGILIYQIKGWNYQELNEKIEEGLKLVRENHIPALFHVQQLTQPQGHSTSGSHERYKSAERLEWEKEWDCIKMLGEFILEHSIADEDKLNDLRETAKLEAKQSKEAAWKAYLDPIKNDVEGLAEVVKPIIYTGGDLGKWVASEIESLKKIKDTFRRDILKTAYQIQMRTSHLSESETLKNWYQNYKSKWALIYDRHTSSESANAIKKIEPVAVEVSSEKVNGYEVLNAFFKKKFETDDRLIAFGEDLGKIGDVNQGFAGLQGIFGESRIFDTGIREASIIGQGIGLAMRGLRPIAEIQYLDYLLYGLQPLSDDVATLEYRSHGQQKCPIIVRTRGHRLEGVWHSGSPMGMMLHSLRGINICVPRNMTQAAAMYNTLLASDEPGIVVECLNGYRLKEAMPTNLADMKLEFGKVEKLSEGADVTVVSYGSTLRIIQEAMEKYLIPAGVEVELIDVQTLLPFDTAHDIVKSLEKTNRILIVDEDVPGGASSFIFQKIMEEQEGYYQLDVPIRTLTAKNHRPAYGTDGDYFSKPNAEDVAEKIMSMMEE